MTHKIKILSFCLLICHFCSFGQENSSEYSKWYIKPGVGINIPLTRLHIGEVTDYLIEYDDNSYYWQILSGNYFFHSNWGIEFTYQASSSSKISERAENFYSDVNTSYEYRYFVTSSSGAQYYSFNIIGGNIERGYLGLVYRIENPRLIFLPRLLIGVTSFYTDWGQAYLKEKGTNAILKLSYSPGEIPNDHFTIAPAFTFGYRLSKRLIANIDCLYSYYKTDIKFEKKIRNTFTEDVSIERINYKKNMHTLTIGIGMIIEMKPAPLKN